MSEQRLPQRPSVPAVLYALVAVVAMERMVLRRGWGLHDLLVPLAVGSAATSALLLLAFRHRGKRGMGVLLPLCVAVLAGALDAGMVADSVRCGGQALSASAVSAWELAVEGDMTPSASGWRGRARATSDQGQTAVVWLSSSERLERGTALRCVGRFQPSAEDEWGVASRMQGVCGSVRCVRATQVLPPAGLTALAVEVRSRALAAFDDLGGRERATLRAGVCGERSEAKELGLDETFSTCGVAHLMAVSGGHLAVVAALVDGMLERWHVGPRARSGVTMGVGAAFVALCGMPLSAVRAWLMCAVASGSAVVGRRSHPVASVSVVALAMALLDPTVSGQLSYLLSVTAVCCLALFSAHARYALAVVLPTPRLGHGRAWHAMRKRWESARGLTASALVAAMSTAPLIVPAFGRVSVVGPVANAVLSPAFTLMLQLGVVAAALSGVPVAGSIASEAAGVLASAFLWLLDAFARVPFASVALDVEEAPLLAGSVALAVVLLVWWPRVDRRVATVAACAVLALLGGHYVRWRYLAPARVVVLDVGQGDAILVQDGAAAVLVDTGPDDSVATELAEADVYHLDAVVLTHLHEDHVGGVDDLVGAVPCGEVLVAQGVCDTMGEELRDGVRELTGRDAGELVYGDVLAVGNYRLRVVWPRAPVSGNQNADSVELALAYDGPAGSLTGLLTGDAERDQTDACIEAGDVGRIDLLKVGHHGSEVSVSEKGARALSPLVAVASAGEGNDYGHPRQECVDILEGVGARFLCTKDVGSVTVMPGREGPIVRYEHPLPDAA